MLHKMILNLTASSNHGTIGGVNKFIVSERVRLKIIHPAAAVQRKLQNPRMRFSIDVSPFSNLHFLSKSNIYTFLLLNSIT